ncbi:MAG: hypothetical protein HFH25_11720 [Lachnospiraceae bacterium]|nr:hypothetical protein [Lachnospiraceae bacterium]
MAKTQNRGGEYRRMLLEQRGQRGSAPDPAGEPAGFLRIRFYVSLCLFVCYLILDYTKASIYTLDSSRIYAAISRDMTQDLDLEETFAKVMDSIWISESEKP